MATHTRPSRWTLTRVGLWCLAASVLVTVVGLAGTGGSLASSFDAVESTGLSVEQQQAAVESGVRAATLFTRVSMTLSAALLMAGVVALGIAFQRRVAAASADTRR